MNVERLVRITSEFPFGIACRSNGIDLAYRDDDAKIALVSLDADDTLGTVTTPKNRDTAKGPDMVHLGGSRYIASRKGSSANAGSDERISWLAEGSSTWDASTIKQSGRPDPVTDKPVSLSVFGDKVFMAYKRDDKHLLGLTWYSTSGGWSWNASEVTYPKDKDSDETTTSTEQGAILNPDGVVTHNWIGLGDAAIITSRAPALATAGGLLCLAFKNHGQEFITLGTTSSPTVADDWTFARVPGCETEGNVALTEHGGKVVLAFADKNDDDKVYLIAYDPTAKSWGNKVKFQNEKDHARQAGGESDFLRLGSDGTDLYLSYSKGGDARLYRITDAGL